ncbi:2-phosphoxylose phosphatase 1-like [Morone saxatilis]|uniref:2-phosphoxylose phosphatase 1-like n=1 Tax=Morone saxatilis TaxID=34816 RepID=UPI0015E2030F|nr:2-phosphoxylose phosphatase 1-like [Morone saxatilis]
MVSTVAAHLFFFLISALFSSVFLYFFNLASTLSLSLYLSPGNLSFSFICFAVNLIPTTPIVEERPFQAADGGVVVALGKSRKRVFPVPHTQEPNPISEAYGYCNTPNRTEQAWEGHSPADYKLLSVQVMIRHGDRYPLYSIPKTKRPAIDCTLSISRKPSHPLLNSFISHMGLGGRGHWESPLSSVPRLPNHSVCEMGELTQTDRMAFCRGGTHVHVKAAASRQMVEGCFGLESWEVRA